MTGQEMFSAFQVLIHENSLLTNSRDAGWLAGIGRFLDKIFSHLLPLRILLINRVKQLKMLVSCYNSDIQRKTIF